MFDIDVMSEEEKRKIFKIINMMAMKNKRLKKKPIYTPEQMGYNLDQL